MQVLLPAALTRLFPGCPAALDLHADTIAGLLAALDAHHPGMRDRLCDATPAIRRHIHILADGRRAGLATELHDVEEVVILTAISGG
jgi:molybdopterin synthase sulfur carrier subunit